MWQGEEPFSSLSHGQGRGREGAHYRRGSPSSLGTGGGQLGASCWARHWEDTTRRPEAASNKMVT